MRRVFLATMMGLGLLFGTMNVPAPVSKAASPAPQKTEATKTIVAADEPIGVPETTIVAPTKPVRRGHQVVFGVAPIKDAPKELLHYTYVWVITPDPGDAFMLPDNSKGSFGTGEAGDPTEYTLTVVANYLFIDAKNAATLKSTKTTAVVEIEDRVRPTPVPPGPAPGPGPTPPPPAPVPDGKYKLGSFILDHVKSLPKEECTKLAVELRRLSGLIAAGAATPTTGIKTKGELVKQTATAFTTALGSNLKNWQSALDALAKQMDTLNIVALPDCQTAYDEVATGLEAR